MEEEINETLYIQNLNEKIKPDGSSNSRHENPSLSAICTVRQGTCSTLQKSVQNERTGFRSL